MAKLDTGTQGKLGNARKVEKGLVARNINDMQSGQTAFSDQDIRQGMAANSAATNAKTAGIQTALQRQIAGNQGPAVGRTLAATQQVAAQSAAPVAQAAAQQRDLGSRLTEARNQEIVGRLAREGDIKRANTQEWLKGIGGMLATTTGGKADMSSGGSALGTAAGSTSQAGIAALTMKK